MLGEVLAKARVWLADKAVWV